MQNRLTPRFLSVALAGAVWLGCSNNPADTTPPKPPLPSAMDVVTEVDYGLALRTAALKLTGNLPTLTDGKGLEAATDQKMYLQQRVDAFLADPRFRTQQLNFWRDTFKMGGTPLL